MVYRICGCRTYMSEHPNLFIPMVEYCSMHKAAPQLLEACEVIKGWIGNPDDGVDPIRWDFSFEPPWYKKLSVAIAAAKEKER